MKPMRRGRAAAIHLGLTALVALIVLAVIYFVWYPGPLFDAAGGKELFLLIAGVDVTLGPLITFIIFVPGKKGLAFDLATIAILQVAALSYGGWILFDARPVWIVFVKDRFEMVRANQVFEAERKLAKPPFDERSVSGPRLAGAEMPSDPTEQLRIAMTAVAGQDLQTYPQYLRPYDTVRSEVAERAWPLRGLKAFNPGAEAEVAQLPSRFGRREEELRFLPLRVGKRDLTAIVDDKGDYLGAVALKPWEY